MNPVVTHNLKEAHHDGCGPGTNNDPMAKGSQLPPWSLIDLKTLALRNLKMKKWRESRTLHVRQFHVLIGCHPYGCAKSLIIARVPPPPHPQSQGWILYWGTRKDHRDTGLKSLRCPVEVRQTGRAGHKRTTLPIAG
jgi:hypothetical protein